MSEDTLFNEMRKAILKEADDEIKEMIREYGVECFYDLATCAGETNIFHYKIIDEDVEFVRFLLELGWDVNRKGTGEWQTAFALMRCKNEKIRKLLLEKGVDLNVQDRYENTPLMESGKWNEIEDIKWLFLNGADPNIQNSTGISLFHLIHEDDFKELIPLFLQYPEKWNEENWKFLKEKRLQVLMK